MYAEEEALPPGYPPVEQHRQLLPPVRFPAVPTSAAQFADSIERGGAKIEETLDRIHCKYGTLFFAAAWGVVIAASLAVILSFFHFQLANFVNSVFLLFFGSVIMVLDIPGSPRWAGMYRRSIRKHARFLTRLTGKSVWLLYLGCLVIVSLWPGRSSLASGILLFVAILASLFVNFVAIMGLFVALRKSLLLERVRRALQDAYQGNCPEVYRKYAITDPSHGMQFEEFSRLAGDYSGGKVSFDMADLAIIFNALDDHQKSAINEREFTEWMTGAWMTYL